MGGTCRPVPPRAPAGVEKVFSAGELDRATPGRPRPSDYRLGVSVFGGGHFFNKDHPLGRRTGDSPDLSPASGGVFGAGIAWNLNPWLAIEGEVSITPTKTANKRASLTIFGYRGQVVINLTDQIGLQPFILVGYGGLSSVSGESTVVRSDTMGAVHGGAGFKLGFTARTGLRIEGRLLAPTTIPFGSADKRIPLHGPDYQVLASIFANFCRPPLR